MGRKRALPFPRFEMASLYLVARELGTKVISVNCGGALVDDFPPSPPKRRCIMVIHLLRPPEYARSMEVRTSHRLNTSAGGISMGIVSFVFFPARLRTSPYAVTMSS